MRITFLTNRDLHANIALNLLRPLFDKHQVSLFLSESVGRPAAGWRPPNELLQLKFIEQGLFNQFICPLAEQQNSTQGRYLTFNELGALSGNGCLVLDNINSPKGLAKFTASAPDLVISIRFGKIIKAPIIAQPRFGVLNLHSGLLPQYQGILTTLHALLAGDPQVGCTLHYIDSGDIDTGEIIASASFASDKLVSLFGHVLRLYPMGTELIVQAVAQLEEIGTLESTPQDTRQQHYYGLPEARHFNALAKQGFTLWHQHEVIEALQNYLPGEQLAGVF